MTKITLDGRDEAVLLFGPRDQHLKMIREAMDLKIIARGDTIQLDGDEEQITQAVRVLTQLRHILSKNGQLDCEDVRSVLSVVQQGEDADTPQSLAVIEGGRSVRPRTDGQGHYVRTMQTKDLVLCVGPAGTGKCVAEDTLVVTGEGVLPIRDLADGVPVDGYKERPTQVVGINGPTQASHVYNGGCSPTIRIRTRHGFELEGTPEHPVLTMGPTGDPQWCALDELRAGSFVAIARGANVFGKDVRVDFHYDRNPNDHCSRPVTLDRLDTEFAYFMGLLVGDGCLHVSDRILFSSADDQLRAFVEKFISQWDLHWFPMPSNPHDMVICSRQFRQLLEHLGLDAVLAHEKQVPRSILRAPRELVVAFLQGLFDTDGTVELRSGYPSLATSSPMLARQVQLLLLNLSIVAALRRKRTKCRPAYILDILGAEATHFGETIGFRLKRKADRLVPRKRNPNIDVIPHVASLIDTAIRGNTLSRTVHKEIYDYRIGRRSPSHAKLGSLLEQLPQPLTATDQLRWLYDHNFLWSEVTHSELGFAQVYDLTVPGNHSFVAGGFVNHNTYLAVAMAVTLLRKKAIRKIILVRPAVEAGERLGYLPGDLSAKINPYLRPLFDALADFMETEQLRRYIENDIIEILPLAYMRGRTLNNALIILDEGQNATIPQMKMFLTRMGNNSKIIVTGDITQVDLPRQSRSGLLDAMNRLRGIDGIGLVYLNEKDIVRHPLVQQIVRAYEETEK